MSLARLELEKGTEREGGGGGRHLISEGFIRRRQAEIFFLKNNNILVSLFHGRELSSDICIVQSLEGAM